MDFSQFQPMGGSLSTVGKNFTTPYSTNYNLPVERQLPGEMILRVGRWGYRKEAVYVLLPSTPPPQQVFRHVSLIQTTPPMVAPAGVRTVL